MEDTLVTVRLFKKLSGLLGNMLSLVCHFIIIQVNRVGQGFRLNKASWLFLSHFQPLLKQVVFLEAAGAAVKIACILKPNHQNQVKLVSIPVLYCVVLLLLSWQVFTFYI